jgi:N-acetylglucosaminyl-diphospho-decaprenol L-rhamnosyltransferase
MTIVKKLTISIVSHGHSKFVLAFAHQLAAIPVRNHIRLIITINAPALDDFNIAAFPDDPLTEIALIQNLMPKGFGANHNQAFKHCNTDLFCVINPDIELKIEPFSNLINAIADFQVGLAYPLQIDVNSAQLDFERELVKPSSIIKRHLLRQIDQSKSTKSVHWVSGAFMMFKTSVFRELGGFDERYFMYCEDVDICLRLQLAGYTLARADAVVIHHTQRKTLKNFQHLAWHVRSLFRLWTSTAYEEYKRQFIDWHK